MGADRAGNKVPKEVPKRGRKRGRKGGSWRGAGVAEKGFQKESRRGVVEGAGGRSRIMTMHWGNKPSGRKVPYSNHN